MLLDKNDIQKMEREIGNGAVVMVGIDVVDHALALYASFPDGYHYNRNFTPNNLLRMKKTDLINLFIIGATKALAASNEQKPRVKSPWPDFYGHDIFEGDIIQHPSGESGTVIFLPDGHDVYDQWRVDYGAGGISRLLLQIGDKGRASVVKKVNDD